MEILRRLERRGRTGFRERRDCAECPDGEEGRKKGKRLGEGLGREGCEEAIGITPFECCLVDAVTKVDAAWEIFRVLMGMREDVKKDPRGGAGICLVLMGLSQK
ncbi:MAG: hypothetical protein FWG14_06595 [Peptococcaceae bacterium]|nr:hypothetical protein [Peptococcaceae bacterium]